ncbi:MAG: hypothetical protein GY850_24265 [bacterium]|nr:hypothetical protein [bacterium]
MIVEEVIPFLEENIKILAAEPAGEIGVKTFYGKRDGSIPTTNSTFFHAVLPGLVNAVHHKSDITLVVLDNSGTAMTGFQPHPGLDKGLADEPVLKLDIQKICESMGITVRVTDPFDFEKTGIRTMELQR